MSGSVTVNADALTHILSRYQTSDLTRDPLTDQAIARLQQALTTHAARQARWALEGRDPSGKPLTGTHRLNDIDPVAVQAVIDGHPLNLNQGEKRAVVAILTARNIPGHEIAARLRCSVRNVERIRALQRTINKENAA